MRFRIALAAVLALLAVFACWVVPRMRVETNLLALLPSTAENRQQLDAVKKFADRSSRELVFVVGTAARDKLRATGAAFAESLRASGAFARVDFVVGGSGGSVYRVPNAGGVPVLIGNAAGLAGAVTWASPVTERFRLNASAPGSGASQSSGICPTISVSRASFKIGRRRRPASSIPGAQGRSTWSRMAGKRLTAMRSRSCQL